MRHLILPLLALGLVSSAPSPARADECGSIVASACDDITTGAKVVSVKTSATAYATGDRFPYETRSLLMDPLRYSLKPSDGTWRYYAMDGVVYRVQNGSGIVLEVIRNRRTAHLR